MRRQDGTPLDFSSRASKQEALRQHKIEEAYNVTQAMWGLPATGSGAAEDRQPVRLAPRGRGRHMVRPAWLTRMESASATTQ